MREKPLAIVVSDIHLSHTPPSARSAEPDWYTAMERTLAELKHLVRLYDNPPVICCGDVFDRWNSSPELINFAIKNLPMMYSVSGQHDQPHHRYDDLRKSAYQTLVEAATICDLPLREPLLVSSSLGPSRRSLCLVGFPYGYEMKPFAGDADGALRVAVAHSYVWTNENNSYKGAPKEKRLTKLRRSLKGYDVALFGDNHTRFLTVLDKCIVLNCGALIRRKMDERQQKPSIALLQEDGSIAFHYLSSTDDDKFVEGLIESAGETSLDSDAFLSELSELNEMEFDFVEVVKRFMDSNKLSDRCRQLLVEVMEQ